MKKYLLTVIVFLLLLPISVSAGRGCCSHHGGVCGCNSYGMSKCCDGTSAKAASCACTPPKVKGCTDPKANNYNSNANYNDGSCKYTVYGSTDEKANNYNAKANKNDGSCKYDVLGCTDKTANNYDSKATKDNGKCTYDILGCTDSKANNYNSRATKNDGSCKYDVLGCTDSSALNYNPLATKDDSSCKYKKEEQEIEIDTNDEELNKLEEKETNEELKVKEELEEETNETGFKRSIIIDDVSDSIISEIINAITKIIYNFINN